MNNSVLPLILILVSLSACRPDRTPTRQSPDVSAGKATPETSDPDPCEGCEAIHEYGDRVLQSVDTLPEFASTEPKLHLSGTVYQPDGITPAPGIIIYIYHTDPAGLYPLKGDETGWARHHGYLRGWTRTGPYGHYEFYTFRPGHYPSRNSPQHIHLTILEPGRKEYWIDSVHFTDDPLLTTEERKRLRDRGGSGIVKPDLQDGLQEITRDIVLGQNIPGYDRVNNL